MVDGARLEIEQLAAGHVGWRGAMIGTMGPRGMSWPVGRWRPPSATWGWRNGRRCRRGGRGRRSWT